MLFVPTLNLQFEVCFTCFLTVMMDTKEEVAAAWEVMKEDSNMIYPLEAAF
ncbi:MAG: hypothetical protein IKP40_06490 [Clostridia bacterium]|nr:hypothetical protein [Clostridia bacterium]